MNYTQITDILHDDIMQLNACIMENLTSHVVTINDISTNIIKHGGKRIRSLLLLLVCQALNCKHDKRYHAATAIELIHTATLLHDDVVDEAEHRRGTRAAHKIFGNATAILTGDFLYSRAFQMLVKINNMEIMHILSDATNVIAEGEVLQLQNRINFKLSTNEYLNIIYCKTAKLFEASCAIAVILSDCPQMLQEFMNYGRHLGNAFQIIDDINDLIANIQTTGKTNFNDILQGNITLPLIHILNVGTKHDMQFIVKIMQSHDNTHNDYKCLLEILYANNAIEYAQNIAHNEIIAALKNINNLLPSIYKELLENLCHQLIAFN